MAPFSSRAASVPGCRPIAHPTECRYSLRHDCISPPPPPSSRCAATRASLGAPAALTVLALRQASSVVERRQRWRDLITFDFRIKPPGASP
ncbi:hypothetical protein L810_2933 [Burkholderia sp. AU4i]|nr:hypothetical protein L810_2933 [Burkholderia sp. AU4i]